MTHAIAPPKTPLRDPVCGMEITPSDAVVTRTRGTQTYYFCSEVCVERFDAVPPPVAPASEISAHIDLPISGLTRSGGPALQRALETTPGISRAAVNPGDGCARVDYDPARTSPGKLVGAIRTLGLEVGAASVRLKVTGLYCAGCTVRIEKALKTAPGVLDATFNAATEEARVEYLPSATDQPALLAAVEAAGPYTAQLAPVATESALDTEAIQQASEYRALMRKFWFAAAVGTATMVLSYPYLIPGLSELLPRGSDALRLLWGVMGLASLAVLVYSGNQFYVGMWQGIRRRSANMHTLIAVGTGVAWLYSTIVLLVPSAVPSQEMADVYYDVTVVVTALVVLGLALEAAVCLPSAAP